MENSSGIPVSPADRFSGGFWGGWATLGFGAIITIAFFIAQMLVAFAFAFSFIFSTGISSEAAVAEFGQKLISSSGLLVALAVIVSAVTCIFLISVFIKLRKGSPFLSYIGLKSVSLRTCLISIGIILGFAVLSDFITYSLGKPISPDSMVSEYSTAVWPPLFWVAVIVFAPAFEEIFFRGFLFEGLRRSRLRLIGTIFLTSLFWALLHTQYDWYTIASIFVTGIILGVWRYKTGSLWSTLLMHMAANVYATTEVAIHIDKYLH